MALGGHLVAINDEDENKWLVSNFADEDTFYEAEEGDPEYFRDAYWTGLRREGESFSWSNGNNFEYSNFGDLEPAFNGDYGEITLRAKEAAWARDAGNWNDEVGHHPHYGIAEIPFIRRDGSAYVIVEGPTWEEAEANAVALGGNLVAINDEEENSYLMSAYESYVSKTSGGPDFWIGYTDKDEEGVWSWADGSESTYTNWRNSEPNNRIGSYPTYDDEFTSAEWWLGEQAPSDPSGQDFAVYNASSGNWGDAQNNHRDGSVGIAEIHLFDFELNYQLNSAAKSGLSQNAVLGDSIDETASYTLEITGESLRDGYRVESADITLEFDTLLFNDIQASDIRIGGAMPIANAVAIDNEAGTIRIAASSLSDLASGTGIDGETVLASINLDFDETSLNGIEKNADGSLKTNPLSFSLSANADETVFSKDFVDTTGLLNREIVTLNDLGGYVAVDGQDVTLYEAKINFEQQGDGLVLGTQRVIGADATFTNLIRSGDTLTTSVDWLNVGNIQANNLSYSEVSNQNATLESAAFSQTNVASGSFIDGVFVEEARESTTLTADIKVTGQAGNVLDLSDGIVSIKSDGSEIFTNSGKGSSNLITFQGDLNYDGRVSMKDLAYLNAGAARQQTSLLDVVPNQEDQNNDGIIDASVAHDVDADFSGKIDLADLSVLDADWGKSLHTGDEQFHGSAPVQDSAAVS
ncbi:hypothetical protein N8696_01425, partial [bacterium]|nr:hypothetical protein [bacterium]